MSARPAVPALAALLVVAGCLAGCTTGDGAGTAAGTSSRPAGGPALVALPGSVPVSDLAVLSGRVAALTADDAGPLLVGLDDGRPDAGLPAGYPGRPGELLEVRGTLLAATRGPDTVLGLEPEYGRTQLLAELADTGGAQLATGGGDAFAVSAPASPGDALLLAVFSGDVVATGIPLPLAVRTGTPAGVDDLAVLHTDTATSLVVATVDTAGAAWLSWLDVTVPGAVTVPRTQPVPGRVTGLAVRGKEVLAAVTRDDRAWLLPLDGGPEVDLGAGRPVDLVATEESVAVLVQDGGDARVVVTDPTGDRVVEEVALGNGVHGTALTALDDRLVAGGGREGSPVLWLLS